MKKIFLLLFLITVMIQNFSKLQAQGGFEIQKEAYEKSSDVNIAMGIPNINFPLFNIPTNSNRLNVDVSLNYIANDMSSHNMVSDVGRGWNILAGFAINRISHTYSEDYTIKKNTDNVTYCESNVFQYSIPGGSGKFTINYDKTQHALVASQFKLSKEKIIIEKNSDTLTYKIKSFTVIDENGFRYVFDKNDISYYAGSSLGNSKVLFHTNYNISKITDEKNNTLVTYNYDTTSKQITSGSTSKSILRHKLIKITIPNIGAIDFVYSKSLSYPVDEDNYKLQKITLKDIAGNITQQSIFENYMNLVSLSIQGRNSSEIKKYTFEYNNYGESHQDPYGFVNSSFYCGLDEGFLYTPYTIHPQFSSAGALSKVYLPTGGKIEYEYESNTLPGDSNFRIEKILEFKYDTSITRKYFFTTPALYQKTFVQQDVDFGEFLINTPVNPNPFSYGVFNNANNQEKQLNDYVVTDAVPAICDQTKFFLGSGENYKFQTYGDGKGIIRIYGLRATSELFQYAKGLRIKSIKKYESDSSAPIESLHYDYNFFANNTTPSSVNYSSDDSFGYIGLDLYKGNEYIVYTNVKVTDSVKKYSTKYTFLSPDIAEQTLGIQPSNLYGVDFNNDLKTGMPLFVEQYEGSGKLVYKQEFTYTMDTKMQNNYLNAFSIPWRKNQSVTGKTYMENNVVLTDTSLLTYESEYGNLKSEKSTDANGEIIEKKYQYAFELNNQKLLNANSVGIPLIQEIINTKNGVSKTLSKTELKFDNPAHNWATSSVAYDVITGSPETVMTIDKYDEFGNPLQTTSKSGIPTTLVYGYSNTQIIAKIEGITYDALQNLNLLTPVINASNDDATDATKEGQLLAALDSFRKNQALKDYYITTYTYDPFIGVTSETSALGIRKKYVYNNVNNLIKITDVNGTTLEEYKNNIKQH
ncbi:hypothetical protein QFZ37_002089 [Chryseobacterium ginsenosidimutans]|uniref:hypothetical protein n=1 Tax=Chryseobacterium ginsenosidimutans TaxID=687846 RepID=UPI002782D8E9|nr:hypothetical protein [Chryseobacterium ginsenosidimutans]MDQ0593720.1 hypothetical protein [Chryseobacterium ginsenosidimutans]